MCLHLYPANNNLHFTWQRAPPTELLKNFHSFWVWVALTLNSRGTVLRFVVLDQPFKLE